MNNHVVTIIAPGGIQFRSLPMTLAEAEKLWETLTSFSRNERLETEYLSAFIGKA